jgi:hypothetical protein
MLDSVLLSAANIVLLTANANADGAPIESTVEDSSKRRGSVGGDDLV